jgi:hypothetical protein
MLVVVVDVSEQSDLEASLNCSSDALKLESVVDKSMMQDRLVE